ncbi:MAG: hypothetical protein O7G85_01185 [Planctomycetota bacterium]|nr:hypothetical protein [Planctomycetota bacterium]
MTTLRTISIIVSCWLGLAALLLGLSACDEKTKVYEFPLESELSWPYWPVTMRVHVLTRFVEDAENDRYWLEARIEFRDQDDDITKCYGQINLKLFVLLPSGESSEAVGSWDVNLLDPDENRIHFDVVTSTYLFKLDVTETHLAKNMELNAVFTAAGHFQFESSMDVQPKLNRGVDQGS